MYVPKQRDGSQHAGGSQIPVNLLRHDVAFVVFHLHHILSEQLLFFFGPSESFATAPLPP